MFCYELTLPISKRDELFTRMQTDLNLYLPYTAKVMSRKRNCLVLVKLSSIDKIKSKGGKALYKDTEEDGLHVRNQPLKSTLLYSLKVSNYHLSTPIIDKTNYLINIDIDIKSKLSDIKEVRKELKKYNLDLIEKEISIPMLVIKDRDK